MEVSEQKRDVNLVITGADCVEDQKNMIALLASLALKLLMVGAKKYVVMEETLEKSNVMMETKLMEMGKIMF